MDFRCQDYDGISEQKQVNMQLFCRHVYLRLLDNARILDLEMSVKDKVPLKEQMTGVREGHSTGLSSLSSAVCLHDQLAHRMSPLTGSTVHKVSCPVCW